VLGTSAAELRFAHALLSRHPALLCHRQLFHPTLVELAPGINSLAGYGAFDMALRNRSAPDFLADLVRAEPDRQTGFLLRSGHGWHIPEVLFDRPSAKVIVIHGDPLIGFIESLGAVEPLIDTALDEPALLRSLPPTILVKRFAEYERQFALMKDQLTAMVANSKPKGLPPSWSWLSELDLDVTKPSRIGSRWARSSKPSETGWVALTLARWRDWLTQAETCLGVTLVRRADHRTWSRLAGDLGILQRRRQVLVDLLIAGGRTGPIPASSAVDEPLHPPAEPKRATATAEMVAAGLAKRAAEPDLAARAVDGLDSATADFAPAGLEAIDVLEDASASSRGRPVPGNGVELPDQADQPESALTSEMNREPRADPSVPDR
jgi:hypothetical protein